MSADLSSLVASPHWRWMVGMRDQNGYVFVGHSGDIGWWALGGDCIDTEWTDERPDLSNPATIGCLLTLVREAWGDPTICVQHRGGVSASVDAWLVTTKSTPEHYGKGHFSGATESEALITALLAAPPKDGGGS